MAYTRNENRLQKYLRETSPDRVVNDAARPVKKERSRKNQKTAAGHYGLPDGLTRYTVILPKDLVEKVKGMREQTGKKIQDIFTEALARYMEGK